MLLRVADSGQGMASDVKERLFEPFFTTKGPTKGSGLGLATVYAIVKQLRGVIRVESEPGAGSTFLVDLPASERQEEPAVPIPEATPVGGNETILVAEDEPAVRSLLGKPYKSAELLHKVRAALGKPAS